MRIAYFVPAYTYPKLPTFVVNEMNEIQKAGHDVVVVPLYRAPGSPVDHETFARLKPVAVLPDSLCDAEVVGLALWMFLTRPWRILKALIALHWSASLNPYTHAALIAITPKALATSWRLGRLKVDHIHAHFATHTTTCAGIAGVVSGISFSFTAHAYDIYCTTPKLRNDTLCWKLRHADKVFAVSEYGANLLRQLLPIADRDRVYIVHVGIPMHLFRPEPSPTRDGVLRLLCVARFDEKKGLDTLIDACALLRRQAIRIHLRLYGDGPLKEALADQIARLELGEQVTMSGPITQEEVARQMVACHLFVMPCRKDQRTGDMDGIPTVFAEAMACGRPVVSCPISGIPELVRDGETGLLIPPDNPSALAEALARLACDETQRIRLGQQARALVERQHDQRLNARRLLDRLTGVQPLC